MNLTGTHAGSASVTLMDQLARMLTSKGVLGRGERELIFKNAISFLRIGDGVEARQAADVLERFWEQGWRSEPVDQAGAPPESPLACCPARWMLRP